MSGDTVGHVLQLDLPVGTVLDTTAGIGTISGVSHNGLYVVQLNRPYQGSDLWYVGARIALELIVTPLTIFDLPPL